MDIFKNQEPCDFIAGKVILIDKPLEWTSFDVVNKIRYLLKSYHNVKKIKVGHAGTLDPLATGLLIICTGKFTKKIESFQAQEKEYITTLKLGVTTPSFDRETAEDQYFNINHIDKTLLLETLHQFLGEQQQIPPIFSAKKVNGKKAYEAARNGQEIKLKSNTIVIHELELLNFNLPFVKLRIKCSKGTYIRALGRDIGKKLGSGAYLHNLKRTKIGAYHVENAFEISELEKKIKNLQPFKN